MPQPAAPSTAFPSRTLRILLVEDEPALARNIVDYLQLLGHQTDYAADGKLGLQLALQQQFDVILLDLMLPRLDGLSLCRQLRSQASRQKMAAMAKARVWWSPTLLTLQHTQAGLTPLQALQTFSMEQAGSLTINLQLAWSALRSSQFRQQFAD